MRHLFAVSLVLLSACGDGGTGESDAIPDVLAGSWEASLACSPECHFTLVRLDDPSQSLDFVSGIPGSIFLLELTRQGGFELEAVAANETIRGTVRAEGSLLILRDNAGVQDTADWSIAGEYLRLDFRGETDEFDFDQDGLPDPATIRARFRRR
ncbi:MAG TPA: hypothetical protein VFZ24_08315 [Longimicrobiales bacterium]